MNVLEEYPKAEVDGDGEKDLEEITQKMLIF